MESDRKKKLCIGIIHPREKFEKGAFIRITEEEDTIWLDPTQELESQAKGKNFDVVILKLTDWLNNNKHDDRKLKPEEIIMNVRRFLEKRPNVKVIDPFENTVILNNRKKLSDKLKSLKLPTGVLLPDNISLETKTSQFDKSIKLPCIMKPYEACGSELSHRLTVINNWNDMKDLDDSYFPAIAETIIHHKLLIKTNVIMCKKSGPIVYTILYNDKIPEGRLETFDSQEHTKEMNLETGYSLTKEENNKIVETCRIVSLGLELTILGLDFVKNDEDGTLYLIDVNFFPSCSRNGERHKDLIKACEECM